MKNKTSALLLSICLALPVISAHAEEPLLILQRTIMTLDAADKIAHATIEACRKEGTNVAVTVIGRNGQTLALLRDTLAMEVTIDLSRLKAVTALSMNSNTSTLTDRYKNPGALEKYEGLLFMPGGVSINAGGQIMGAVGVSGAPDSKIDEKCALQGVDAVLGDLEMAM